MLVGLPGVEVLKLIDLGVVGHGGPEMETATV